MPLRRTSPSQCSSRDDKLLLTKGYGVGSTLWQFKLDGDKWTVEPLWKNNNLKTKMTNAVVHDGYAYGLDEGTLCCLELATGKRKWKRNRYGHGQVLLVGDLLLVQSENGEIALVEPSAREVQRTCTTLRRRPGKAGTIRCSWAIDCSCEASRRWPATNCPWHRHHRRPRPRLEALMSRSTTARRSAWRWESAARAASLRE